MSARSWDDSNSCMGKNNVLTCILWLISRNPIYPPPYSSVNLADPSKSMPIAANSLREKLAYLTIRIVSETGG